MKASVSVAKKDSRSALEDWNDLLKDLLSPDTDDEINLGDLLSD